MKQFTINKKTFFICSLYIFISCYLFLSFVGELGFYPDMLSLLLLILVSNLILIFRYMAKGDYLSPNSLFIISVVIFILVRPILSAVGDFEVITIGEGISAANIIKTVIYVILVVNLIALTTIICNKKIDRYYNSIPKINTFNKCIEVVFFVMALLFSIYFIVMSYKGMMRLVNGMNYFQFAEFGAYNHLKYFFYAKFCFLISYLFSKNRIGLVFITACCFIASIGFIIIGLRGYTIAYLFLFLTTLNLKFKIKILPLILIAGFILIVSSMVLNFRLGFNLTTSYIDMLLAPFHQQGASFEVVFGAVNFREELISCISFTDYFLKQDFGSCVDKVRGVDFAEGGGFASSYFAEVYYLGILPAIFISVAFGLALSFLNSAYLRLKNNLYSDKLSGVIVFFIIPNLVYFARSSAFDFVIKTAQVIILLMVILFIKWLVSKNGKIN